MSEMAEDTYQGVPIRRLPPDAGPAPKKAFASRVNRDLYHATTSLGIDQTKARVAYEATRAKDTPHESPRGGFHKFVGFQIAMCHQDGRDVGFWVLARRLARKAILGLKLSPREQSVLDRASEEYRRYLQAKREKKEGHEVHP